MQEEMCKLEEVLDNTLGSSDYNIDNKFSGFYEGDAKLDNVVYYPGLNKSKGYVR